MCCRGSMIELGLEDVNSTVGQIRMALDAGEASCVCINGKRLPDDADVQLSSLDIDPVTGQGQSAKVFICPLASSIEGALEECCPMAAPRLKPTTQLGLERFLTLWIILAVAAGIGLGQVPNIHVVFDKLKVGNTNLLSAIGMIAMLVPPFAAVKYDELLSNIKKTPKRIAVSSVVLNWIVGPLLMLFLGMVSLYNHVDLLQGLVFIGAARCIAMVLVWTALADGDGFLCVTLVLLNSLITVVTYAPVVTLLGIMALSMGVGIQSNVTLYTVVSNVAVFLGIPLVIGFTMWLVGHKDERYFRQFLPNFGPVGLISLLFTILVMFTEMSKSLLNGGVAIGDVCWVVLALLCYFTIMFSASWLLGRFVLRIPYAQTVTLAFTAAGNNFELALAACSAIFGTSSKQAVATVIGPLLEIPVMLLLVKLSLWLRYDGASSSVTGRINSADNES